MNTKIILALLFAILASFAKERLVIGATPVPYAEILEFSKPLFAKKGYELEIIEFTDYAVPNKALNEGKLDANLFQHKPYLDEFNKSNGTDLVPTQSVVLVPMGVYSKIIKDIKDLPNGALVSIPNDPTNEDRAFELLVKTRLVEFKEKDGFKTPQDLANNPKKLKFKELKAAQLPRSLDDVSLAIIPTNYALDYGLSPVRDALFIEDKDSNYAIIIAVRKADKESAKTKAINEVLHSKELREFILKKYGGNVIPTF
ncbi:MetQ/NlpA family ABC transporter substrate-binding protein [Campylobacter troglodytis]|uniref:MetQ/NlpA family ABC transporter substrate-binding protein n=1 Tax=Campylobacter troglodytis TaxID=654363 RepID=UPI001159BB1E|nr:MetQ/NlpA family ABC transporter substrate-binding protein [Campylobacter troglodytis]TQR61496.1 methionine ABC transporter substrate-binding protein [Campylobacter troglodytis]